MLDAKNDGPNADRALPEACGIGDCVEEFACGDSGRAGGEWARVDLADGVDCCGTPGTDSKDGTGKPGPSVLPAASRVWRRARCSATNRGEAPIGKGTNLKPGSVGLLLRVRLIGETMTCTSSQSDHRRWPEFVLR